MEMSTPRAMTMRENIGQQCMRYGGIRSRFTKPRGQFISIFFLLVDCRKKLLLSKVRICFRIQ